MSCWNPDCSWPANYWYIAHGRRIGYCFGHATVEVHTTGQYGRRERKERP